MVPTSKKAQHPRVEKNAATYLRICRIQTAIQISGFDEAACPIGAALSFATWTSTTRCQLLTRMLVFHLWMGYDHKKKHQNCRLWRYSHSLLGRQNLPEIIESRLLLAVCIGFSGIRHNAKPSQRLPSCAKALLVQRSTLFSETRR